MLNTSWCRSERERLGHFPSLGWGCISAGRAPHRHAAEAGSIPRCGKGFFFIPVIFQCRLSYCVRTPPPLPSVQSQALTSVRTLKILRSRQNSVERLRHQACTVCRSWLARGKQSDSLLGENPQGENTVVIFFFFFWGGVNKIRWTVT